MIRFWYNWLRQGRQGGPGGQLHTHTGLHDLITHMEPCCLIITTSYKNIALEKYSFINITCSSTADTRNISIIHSSFILLPESSCFIIKSRKIPTRVRFVSSKVMQIWSDLDSQRVFSFLGNYAFILKPGSETLLASFIMTIGWKWIRCVVFVVWFYL